MSASPIPNSEPVPAQPTSSRPVLDEKKKAKIIALAANGSSRRMTARYVGCAASTITRTAARDPLFREQLAAAEQSADVEALRALRVAARKPRYWRAAAWLLERRHPDDFARRKPETYTAGELASLIGIVVETIKQDLPEESYQRIINKLDQLQEMSKEDVQAERAPPFQMPDLETQWAEAELQREADEPWRSNLDEDDFADDDKDDFEHHNADRASNNSQPRQIPAVSPLPLAEGPIPTISPLPLGEGPGVRADAVADDSPALDRTVKISPLPLGEGPGVRADRLCTESPLVQHPSSAENRAALPPLAVNLAPPYTSELPL